MDAFGDLLFGLGVALQPENLVAAAIGVILGSIVGVLPGIGPLTAMSLLLPISFQMEPIPAIILISGVYYGAMYGGSTTSILLGVPGETSSVMTVVDGYQLRRKGRAGAALAIAALASFAAGIISTLGLVLLAAPLAAFALAFGPPEYFALAVVGLSLVAVLSFGSITKGLISAGVGLLISTVGVDVISGIPRFTFGQPELLGGVHVIVVVLGIFAIAEIAESLLRPTADEELEAGGWFSLRRLLPTRDDLRRSTGPVIRQSLFGFLIGVLPGVGGGSASFLSYGMEKRISKTPERFGQGAIEGVAAPEAANNAGAQGAFVPLLTLGIPGSPAAAIVLAALIIHGLQPGPQLFVQRPDVVWGLIASMLIGNAMLVILNLPLVGLFVQLLRIPFPVLAVLTILLSVVGAYAVNGSLLDIGLVIAFGALGLLMRAARYPLPPLVLALVLGPLLERSLYQSLLITRGDVTAMILRPIPLVVYGIMIAVTVAMVIARVRNKSPEEPLNSAV